jgi:hypothetical protein
MKPYTFPANYGTLVRAVSEEKARRLKSRSEIEVITCEPDAENGLTVPGTCTVFIGLGRDSTFDALRQAFYSQDHKVTAETGAALRHRHDSDEEAVPPPDQLIAVVGKAASIVDVKYGDTALVSAAPLSAEQPIAIFPVPYNGGHLPTGQFSLTSFSKGMTNCVSCFVVLHKPRLSTLERHIVDLIPADASDFQIGPGRPIPANCTPGALVIFIVAATLMHTPFIGARANMAELTTRLRSVGLKDEEIKLKGDLASAEELLTLRRMALWGH